MVLDVAVASGSVPFWIRDQGFEPTDLILENPDTSWRVFRKRYRSGSIGLGVNGLDRTPPAHYVVFIRHDRAREGTQGGPNVKLSDGSAAAWIVTVAGPGASATWDCRKPFKSLPAILAGATLLQPSHDDRHAALLATGRVWKTRVVAGEQPSQAAISFGAEPATELVWTWTTSPAVEETCLAPAHDDPGSMNQPRDDLPGAECGSMRIVVAANRS